MIKTEFYRIIFHVTLERLVLCILKTVGIWSYYEK